MIRVVIVDDQNTIRNYLNMYLGEKAEISVVGLANNGKEAIAVVEKYIPDIVLMDIEMPIMNGIEATRIISERFNYPKILLLTSKEEKQLLNLALKAGARGYILKTAKSNDLDKIIHLTAQGYLQFGPIINQQNLSRHTIVKAAKDEVKQSTSIDLNTQNTLLSIARNVIEIKKNLEYQQQFKTDRLPKLYRYKQQNYQSRLAHQKLSIFSFNLNYKSKKLSRSYNKQNFTLVLGFVLGIITFAILMIIFNLIS